MRIPAGSSRSRRSAEGSRFRRRAGRCVSRAVLLGPAFSWPSGRGRGDNNHRGRDRAMLCLTRKIGERIKIGTYDVGYYFVLPNSIVTCPQMLRYVQRCPISLAGQWCVLSMIGQCCESAWRLSFASSAFCKASVNPSGGASNRNVLC